MTPLARTVATVLGFLGTGAPALAPAFGLAPSVGLQVGQLLAIVIGLIANYERTTPAALIAIPPAVRQAIDAAAKLCGAGGLVAAFTAHLNTQSDPAQAKIALVTTAIAGFVVQLAAWIHTAPGASATPADAPSDAPPTTTPPAPSSGGPGAGVVGLLVALAVTGASGPAWASPLRMYAATSTKAAPGSGAGAAHSPWSVDAHVSVPMVHLDGSIGAGPLLCVGYGSPGAAIVPEVCLAAEFAAAKPDASLAFNFGPMVGLELPVVAAALGLATPPSLVMGWLLMHAGPDPTVIDTRKRAIVLSASFPIAAF